jgi:hypothetical protein
MFQIFGYFRYHEKLSASWNFFFREKRFNNCINFSIKYRENSNISS